MSVLVHGLRMAVRGFARNRVTTAINLVSLGLGLTGFVAAWLLASDMLAVGSRYPDADRIRVVTMTVAGAGLDLRAAPITPTPMARFIRTELPVLDAVAHAASTPVEQAVAAGDRKLYRDVLFAEAAYLEIFPEPLVENERLAADSNNPLTRPRSAVISAATAQALFGNADPLGRTFRLAAAVDVTVAGVFRSPVQTLLGIPIDMIVSIDTANFLSPDSTGIVPESPDAPTDWNPRSMITFVKLPDDSSLTEVRLRDYLAAFAGNHMEPDELGGSEISFDAIPIGRLTVAVIDMLFGGGIGIPITTVILLVGIAILTMSCLNYANLAAAQSLLRAKQIGLTKVFGARRWQVLMQALLESLLIVGAGLGIALAIAELLMPVANAAFAMTMDLPYGSSPGLWVALAALLVCVGVLAGGYPALIMARVRPVEALRAGASRGGRGSLRRILVGSQFATASLLLILVFSMLAHNAAMRARGVDGTEDPLVVVRSALPVSNDVTRAGFVGALAAHPGIAAVTSTGLAPWTFQELDFATLSHEAGSQGPGFNFFLHDVGHDYFRTIGTDMIAGRVFSRDRGDDEFVWDAQSGGDRPRPLHIVIDRSAASRLGWSDPAAAIGQTVHRRWNDFSRPAEIIGVVEDTPYKLVGMGIASASVFFLQPADTRLHLVRIRRGQLDAALAHIDSTWDRFAPEVPIRRELSRDMFTESMNLFDMFNSIFAGLAVFAIFVAAVGLFGAASFASSRRIHEIGVRKTLGATRREIVRMLLWSFTKPVLIANLIAWPVGFAAVTVYYSLFVFRATPGPVPFIASLVTTLAIAWLTVGTLSMRAASAEPARVLRQE